MRTRIKAHAVPLVSAFAGTLLWWLGRWSGVVTAMWR